MFQSVFQTLKPGTRTRPHSSLGRKVCRGSSFFVILHLSQFNSQFIKMFQGLFQTLEFDKVVPFYVIVFLSQFGGSVKKKDVHGVFQPLASNRFFFPGTYLMVQFSISSCFSRSTRRISSLLRRCSSVSCCWPRSSRSRWISSSICSLSTDSSRNSSTSKPPSSSTCRPTWRAPMWNERTNERTNEWMNEWMNGTDRAFKAAFSCLVRLNWSSLMYSRGLPASALICCCKNWTWT